MARYAASSSSTRGGINTLHALYVLYVVEQGPTHACIYQVCAYVYVYWTAWLQQLVTTINRYARMCMYIGQRGCNSW